MLEIVQEIALFVSLVTSFSMILVNQRLIRLNWALLGKPPKGKAFIRMEDLTSCAVIYWDNVKGCCDVQPVFMSESIAESEEQKSIKFYSCPVKTTIITNKG